MKYPYKHTKQITDLAFGVFNRDLPVQTRVAKLLTLTTLVAIVLMIQDWREKNRETPEKTAKTPTSLDPRGRLFLGKQGGKELFIRTAKYPFFNLTTTGKSIVTGDWEEARSILTEQFGTIGIALDTALILTERPNKFEQYTPLSAQLGKRAVTFVPGFRIFNDVGRLLDDKPRQPSNFIQGALGSLPVWGSETTKSKLRGEARSVDIPVEPSVRSIAKKSTTTKELVINKSDVTLSALTGLYITRIDPNDAKQQALRERRNSAEAKIRAYLLDGEESKARALAESEGLIITKGVYGYYQRKRKNK